MGRHCSITHPKKRVTLTLSNLWILEALHPTLAIANCLPQCISTSIPLF